MAYDGVKAGAVKSLEEECGRLIQGNTTAVAYFTGFIAVEVVINFFTGGAAAEIKAGLYPFEGIQKILKFISPATELLTKLGVGAADAIKTMIKPVAILLKTGGSIVWDGSKFLLKQSNELIASITAEGKLQVYKWLAAAEEIVEAIPIPQQMLAMAEDGSMRESVVFAKTKSGWGFKQKLEDLTKVAEALSGFGNLKNKVLNLPDDLPLKFYQDFLQKPDLEVLAKFEGKLGMVDAWKAVKLADVDELLRKNLDFLSKVDETINEGLDPIDALEDAILLSGKTKLTWPEIQVLWKRGNDFNRKGRDKYIFNEIVLQGVDEKAGKRLDSYIPGKEIISRKATTLREIQTSTFEGYLRELITKYKKGTRINSRKLPPDTVLDGDYFLEIPTSNKLSSKAVQNIKKYLTTMILTTA